MMPIRIAPDLPSSDRGGAADELARRLRSAADAGKDVAMLFERGNSIDPGHSAALLSLLASVTAPSLRRFSGLVATGGETARAVLQAAGIAGIRLGGEVEPGVPWGTTGGRYRHFRRHEGRGIRRQRHARARPACSQAIDGGPGPRHGNKRPVSRNVSMTRPVIAITMGDPSGVGPEIVMKSLAHAEVYQRCRPVVVGDAARLRQAGSIVGSSLTVRAIARPSEAQYVCGSVDCVDLALVRADLPWGRISAAAGDAAFRYIERAVALAVGGRDRRHLHRAPQQGSAARGRPQLSRATPSSWPR